jgi:hypothetical protein
MMQNDISDVNVSAAPVGAFLALILAVVIIGIAVDARRRGALQSRGAMIAIAVVVALLVIYGMTAGFLPRL